MPMVTIASIIKDALNKINNYNLALEQSLNEALRISKKAIIHEAKAPLVGVRGPPGTGKTKIMEGLVNDENVISELLEGGVKFVYIAPTNELTTSGFMRALTPIIKVMMEYTNDVKKVLNAVRIYGSAIPSPYFGNDFADLQAELSRIGIGVDKESLKELLRGITYGGIDNAQFIFTTDYQRVSSRTKEPYKYKFVMFVDEASKSPFYLPFNPISDSELSSLARGNEGGVIHGLVVVGDDRQAIALGPEYQGFGKRLLVLPKIKDVLDELGLDDQFKTLRITFRLPAPTEEPIGNGFYGDVGGLEAFEESKNRLTRVFKNVDVTERLYPCEQLVGGVLGHNQLWRDVNKMLDLALGDLNNPKPIIIANIIKSYRAGEQFEPCRVKLAVYFALALNCVSEGSLGISVIAPYRDLVDAARYYYRRLVSNVGDRISRANVRFLTVQSMLGGEDDIVISMLGKEWSPRDEPTIYFREPENLNVQFSRHRLMLIVIGDVTRLRNKAAETARNMGLNKEDDEDRELLRMSSVEDIVRIRKTLDTMLGLAGITGLSSSRIERLRYEYLGYGAAFRKINCP